MWMPHRERNRSTRCLNFIRDALEENGLMEAYRERPPYQQNDDIGWVIGAKQEETKERRLRQMIEELKLGDRFMNMTCHKTD